MEDRTSAGLYLEMTDAAPESYAAQRRKDVRALPGVDRDEMIEVPRSS